MSARRADRRTAIAMLLVVLFAVTAGPATDEPIPPHPAPTPSPGVNVGAWKAGHR